MDIVLDASAIALLNTVIIQIIKKVPWFGKTVIRKKLLAFGIGLISNIIYMSQRAMVDWKDWLGSLGIIITVSFATYQVLVKTLLEPEE